MRTRRGSATYVTYGITANNNPTVQDPWNTTPAWAFPYAASTIAPTPGAGTIIDGAFAAHVGSVGAYAYINDVLYLEASAYRTLDFNAQNDLGTDPFGAPGLFDVAPYWRVAFEPHWGNNWLEIGTFGMMANVHPWVPCAAERRRPRLFRKPTNTPISASIRNTSIRATIIGSRCAAPISTNQKTGRQLPQWSFRQPDRHAQRGAGLCLTGLRQRQSDRAHRPIFQYLG